jgi:hypothetical protein
VDGRMGECKKIKIKIEFGFGSISLKNYGGRARRQRQTAAKTQIARSQQQHKIQMKK